MIGAEQIREIPVWVGRDALLEELAQELLAARRKVIVLVGQGGIGKTSLAVKLLERAGIDLRTGTITESCHFVGSLYLTVNESTGFDTVVEVLLGMLEKDWGATPQETIQEIIVSLKAQRWLIVLDNLEDVLEPQTGKAVSEELSCLLNALANLQHESQVIVTSREELKDFGDYRSRSYKPNPRLVCVKHIPGISIDASIKMLRELELKDRDEDLRWIAARVDGNVFVLEQLANYALGKPGLLRKNPALVTSEAEPILLAQMERQSRQARELLERMCVLQRHADLQAITFLRLYSDAWEQDNRLISMNGERLKFSSDAQQVTAQILQLLSDSYLVEETYDPYRCELRYGLHSLVAEFLRTEKYDSLPRLLRATVSFWRDGGKPTEGDFQILTQQLLAPLLVAQQLDDEGNISYLGTLLTRKITTSFVADELEAKFKAATAQQGLNPVQSELAMGAIFIESGDWERAKRHLNRALEVATSTEEKIQIAQALGALGTIERDCGNWDEAERLFRQSLQLREELGDRAGMASSWGQLGDIERKRGNWDEAERLFRQSLQLREELGDRAGMASSWGVLGYIENVRGNWAQAERLYRQSLQLREELGDRAGMASSWGQLGDIERKRGNWAQAERLYRQSLQLREELGDRAGMASSWASLGYIENVRGNWDEAERLYRQSLQLREELGDRAGMASSWGQLGDIERNRGNWAQAERLYRQSLQLREELGDRAGMASSWGCLGENELLRGNLDTAEVYSKQGLRMAEEVGDTYLAAQIYWDLARLYRQRNNPTLAQTHYETARRLFTQLGAKKDLEKIEREWENWQD